MEELLAVAYSNIPPASTSIPGVWETGLGPVSVTQSTEDPRYNIKMEGSFQNMRVVAPLLPPAEWIVHLQISIPLYCVGRVIGKQGAGMVRMRRTTGMLDVRGFYPLEDCKDRKSLFLLGAFQALTDVLAWLADMIETSSPTKARATNSLMEVVQLNKPLVFVPLMKFDYTLQQ